jgi:hypothetical protein
VLAVLALGAGCHRDADPETAVQAAVARLADTRVPLAERRAELERLAVADDALGQEVLMRVADQATYLNWAAVEALGRCRGDAVETFLKDKLHAADARLATYAVRSYTAVAGDRAVPELLIVLARSRTREDGFAAAVQTAAVQALAGSRQPTVASSLAAELGRAGEPGWDLEYGSALVEALAKTGDASARPPLQAYVAYLAARTPQGEGEREYLRNKRDEVQRALAAF